MQFWCVVFQQVFVYFVDDLFVEGLDVVVVVVVGFQLFVDLVWQFGVVGVGEVCQFGVVGDWYDVGDYWDVYVEFGDLFDEVEIGIGVEEVLGDGVVGVGFYFVYEVCQVIFEVVCLGVDFWIGGDFDVEVVVGFGVDEVYQFVGVVQFVVGYVYV